MSLQVLPDFRIVDECDDWLVVDKAAPLIVHPANRKPEPTLLGGVEILLCYEVENGARPAIVTRLDRDTSGLVLVAKHRAAAGELGKIFERREVEKEYLAIVIGWPDCDSWSCQLPLARAGEHGHSDIWVRQKVHAAGRDCSTNFLVVLRFDRPEGRFALVRCFPETGRMHQIRVHLAASGHPIVGDKIYSGDGSDYQKWMESGWTADLGQRLLLPRHALHAHRLALSLDGVPLAWVAPLPSDLAGFCDGHRVANSPDVIIWSRSSADGPSHEPRKTPILKGSITSGI